MWTGSLTLGLLHDNALLGEFERGPVDLEAQSHSVPTPIAALRKVQSLVDFRLKPSAITQDGDVLGRLGALQPQNAL